MASDPADAEVLALSISCLCAKLAIGRPPEVWLSVIDSAAASESPAGAEGLVVATPASRASPAGAKGSSSSLSRCAVANDPIGFAAQIALTASWRSSTKTSMVYSTWQKCQPSSLDFMRS